MKTRTQTTIIILSLLAFLALIAFVLIGCATKRPSYSEVYIRKEGEPPPPPPPPPCTNCPPYDFTNSPLPILTNGIYLEVVFCNTVIPDTNFPVPFYIVTKANNLSNGMTYLWERTFAELSDGWIPLSSFVATTNYEYRTNGIAAPDHHFFRIVQLP